MTHSLITLHDEQEAKITSITHPDDDMKRRLVDLGFYKGTLVKKVLVSPKGDPVAYRVRGTTIALRNSDAQYIEVEI
ncbi:MAG: FeoA family protein [Vagococcus sp.]